MWAPRASGRDLHCSVPCVSFTKKPSPAGAGGDPSKTLDTVTIWQGFDVLNGRRHQVPHAWGLLSCLSAALTLAVPN